MLRRVGLDVSGILNKKTDIRVSPFERRTIDEFYEKIYDYVKPCIEAADAGGQFDWSCLDIATEKFEKFIHINPFKYVYSLFALSLCEEYNNVNNIDVNFWLHYFICSGMLWMDYPSFTPYLARTVPDHDQYSVYKIPNFTKASYDDPQYYWSVDPLLRAYVTGDLIATKLLIKYGFIFHLPHNIYFEYNFAELILIYLGILSESFSKMHFLDRTPLRKIMMKNYPTQYGKRRLFFVIRTMFILTEISKKNPRYLSLIEPLRLLYQTTPEPYATLDEVRRFLNYLKDEGGRASRVQYLCNRYSECFRESSRPYRPRSLKHLSRWRVRENLRAVNRLPHGLSTLDIPTPLKNYILIQDDSCSDHLCYFDNNTVPVYTGDSFRRHAFFRLERGGLGGFDLPII